jgi:hypothetical protein
MDRKLKTTSTGFPPPLVFARWSQLSIFIHKSFVAFSLVLCTEWYLEPPPTPQDKEKEKLRGTARDVVYLG